jgi:hypothetical protein
MRSRISIDYILNFRSLKNNRAYLYGIGLVYLCVLISSCDPCEPSGIPEIERYISVTEPMGETLLISADGNIVETITTENAVLPKQLFGSILPYTIENDPTETVWLYENGQSISVAFNPLIDEKPVQYPITGGGEPILFGNADTTTIYKTNRTGNLELISDSKLPNTPVMYSKENDGFYYLSKSFGISALDSEGVMIGQVIQLPDMDIGDSDSPLSLEISDKGVYLLVLGLAKAIVINLTNLQIAYEMDLPTNYSEQVIGDIDDNGGLYLSEVGSSTIDSVSPEGELVSAYSSGSNFITDFSTDSHGRLNIIIESSQGERTLISVDTATKVVDEILFSGVDQMVVGS